MDEYRVTSMRVVNLSARHHYQAKRERAAILEMVRGRIRLAVKRKCIHTNAGNNVGAHAESRAISVLGQLADDIEARGE